MLAAGLDGFFSLFCREKSLKKWKITLSPPLFFLRLNNNCLDLFLQIASSYEDTFHRISK